jgi:hypothetical protein
MTAEYHLNLMFEWKGGCLWCGNDAARQKFDVGPVEEKLPLSAQTLNELVDLSTWHDTALNWAYPPDPGPWSNEEYQRFELSALAILSTIRNELGHNFQISYVPLG